MSRPWMPLWIGDYRADTAHLGATEHGIYLLLIMHYWQTGGLPDDDRQLARIACATDTEWKRAKPIISAFFKQPGWKHGRVEEELAEAAKKSAAGRTGGKASGEARRQSNDPPTTDERPTNDRGNDPPTNGQPPHSQLPPPSHSLKDFKALGEVNVNPRKGWTPPRHGATGKGRTYINAGTPEWDAYSADFREANGRDPEPNEHGGKWFKTAGEASH
jgi:uncharacterized protein YdaU (DUF1376 family)